MGLCSKRVVLFELVALLAEHFELAWFAVFDGSDSRQSCGWYDTPQHSAHHRAPKLKLAKEAVIEVRDLSFAVFVICRFALAGHPLGHFHLILGKSTSNFLPESTRQIKTLTGR